MESKIFCIRDIYYYTAHSMRKWKNILILNTSKYYFVPWFKLKNSSHKFSLSISVKIWLATSQKQSFLHAFNQFFVLLLHKMKNINFDEMIFVYINRRIMKNYATN